MEEQEQRVSYSRLASRSISRAGSLQLTSSASHVSGTLTDRDVAVVVLAGKTRYRIEDLRPLVSRRSWKRCGA